MCKCRYSAPCNSKLNIDVDSSSWIFRVAVDPVLLGIPTYFDVIPRKDARDLSLIKSKLDADKYDSIEAFEADVDLMLYNCEKFNHTDAEVLAIAHNFKKRFRELMAGFKSGLSKKRKEGEKGDPHPAAKKVKLL
jgi:transcription initiation factor TFIID subunit 2